VILARRLLSVQKLIALGVTMYRPCFSAGVALVLLVLAASMPQAEAPLSAVSAASPSEADLRVATLPFDSAVQFGPGWHLIGGPAGTTLAGAAGSLYTLQFLDRGYRALPAGTLLTGGLGYWAYFPNGGVALLPAGGPCVIAVPIGAGAWVMVGHPWPTGTATVRGAERVLKYDPAGGYVAGATLRPGEAAWAFSSVATSAAVVVDGCPTIDNIPPSEPVPPPGG